MTQNAIEISNAVKEYRTGGSTFQALKGISLKIKKKEFVSIMGPSGSGKSTLLHMLGCLDTPTEGEVYIDGTAISKMDEDQLAKVRNERIGFVFQAFNLASTLTVFKNVELPLMISEIEEQDRAKKVNDALSIVGLLSKINNKPSQLSGGEKQRVAIARALVNNPQIILADEPTGNLDSKTGKDIMDFLSDLWVKKGITIIIVTHEPVVADYAQKIIHIKDGRVEKEVSGKTIHVSNIDIKTKKEGLL